MCTMSSGSDTPPMKPFTFVTQSYIDIELLVHPLLNSVRIKTCKPKVSNESQIS